jgi:ribosomal-protein-alanine N-acetyltransferase
MLPEGSQVNTVAQAGQELRIHVRWMIRRDMPEVTSIETESFSDPWCEEDFLRCLRQRNCIGMIAEYTDQNRQDHVVGYMIYELHKSRLEVLNFAVHPRYRRRSIGVRMVAKLFSKLESHRRTCVTVTVRETILSALLFFKSQGFLATKIFRSLYEDTGEDGVHMRLSVPGVSSERLDQDEFSGDNHTNY